MVTPLEQQFTADSHAIVLDGLRQVREDVAAGRPVIFHSKVEEYCKDGSTVWTDGKATSLYDENGEFLEIAAVSRDLTLQYHPSEELQTSEERRRLLAVNARDVIWTMQSNGRVSYINPLIQMRRGFSPQEAMAPSMEQTHPSDSRLRSQSYLQQLLNDLQVGRLPQSFRAELEYYCRDGSTIWAEVIALPAFNEKGEFAKLLGVSRDVSERKLFERQLMAANQQLQELASTDSLTGIWNRRQMEASLQQAIDRSDRYGEPLSFILVDIDCFKLINDRLGHPVGDQVWIEFCRRILTQLRSSDGFCRWGGEEILILLRHADASAAKALAEKRRQLIAGNPSPEVGTVTATFGVAQRRASESALDWSQRVVSHVDVAKESGRNRVAGD